MIVSIEFFRIVAFAAMFMHHLSYPGNLGPIGVSLFFVVSGLVVAYNYSIKFNVLSKNELMKFYYSRLARIYPIYFLTFIISLPVTYLTGFKSSLFDAMVNLLMMQAWYSNGMETFSFNSVSWFVSTIWFFTLATPFLLYAINKLRISQSVMRLAMTAVFLFVLAVIIALQFRGNMEAYSFGWWFIYASPYFRIVDYIIGLIAGIYLVLVKESSSNGDAKVFTLLELISLGCLALCIKLPYYKIDALVMSVYYIPAIVFMVIAFGRQKGFISIIMNNKIVIALGHLTYSAYMVHLNVILLIATLFLPSIFGDTGDYRHFSAQVIVFIFTICIADVLHRYWEVPLKDWLINWKRRT